MPKYKKDLVKLSVVIPCYNGASTIAFQLKALAHQRWSEPWEVVVADNGSNDNSIEIVERYRYRLPNLRIVDASARKGQPYALNVGARAAWGEALAFCDADDEVGPGWLAAMGEALSKYDFVACRIETKRLNSPEFHRKFRQEVRLKRYGNPPFLPHAGGGTLGVKKYLYEYVGGFDEFLPCHHDTDFCFKIQLAGKKLHFVSNAVLHLRLRHSYKGLYKQARDWDEYNVAIYKKYRSLGMPKPDWKVAMNRWVRLLRSLPQTRHKAGRISWVKQFAGRMGRLKGSIKYRVLIL